MKKQVRYVEPDDYFPEETRKKYGLGEYADKKTDDKDLQKETKEEKNSSDGE